MSKLSIRFHEDDIRATSDPDFPINCGSFSKISLNLNKSLDKLGLLAKDEEAADIVGFSSCLKMDFGFAHKKRVFIGVWELDKIPMQLISERNRLEKLGNYKYLGLSKQISDAWFDYGFHTDTCDIGVDTDFWKRNNRPENEKFTILSVTACNFRSGIDQTIDSFIHFTKKYPNSRLIIKDTDERNKVLPLFVKELKDAGYDIEYICARYNDYQIKELYERADLLIYCPIMTSAGLPICETASMELPCIVPDYIPTNIYPHSEAFKTISVSISEIKDNLCNHYGLPYTFPPGWIDERQAFMHIDNGDLLEKMIQIKENYRHYVTKAKMNRAICETLWHWDVQAKKLVKLLEVW